MKRNTTKRKQKQQGANMSKKLDTVSMDSVGFEALVPMEEGGGREERREGGREGRGILFEEFF